MKPEVKLEWKQTKFSSRPVFDCVMTQDFVLRLEGNERQRFKVAVLTGDFYGRALYRSNREFAWEEAKAEVCKAGIRIARRQARNNLAVADILSRTEP